MLANFCIHSATRTDHNLDNLDDLDNLDPVSAVTRCCAEGAAGGGTHLLLALVT